MSSSMNRWMASSTPLPPPSGLHPRERPLRLCGIHDVAVACHRHDHRPGHLLGPRARSSPASGVTPSAGQVHGRRTAQRVVLRGLVLAMVLHGIFNFLLFSADVVAYAMLIFILVLTQGYGYLRTETSGVRFVGGGGVGCRSACAEMRRSTAGSAPGCRTSRDGTA